MVAPDERRLGLRAAARRAAPATANAATGSALPFSVSSCRSAQMNWRSASRRVSAPASTPFLGAAACSRAATLTVSPVAPYSTRPPAPTGPTTTGPVSTPTRTARPAIAKLRSTSRANSATPSTIRSAARSARSASSSCAVGAPNSARTPSPARSLTVPPNSSTACTIRATASPTTSRASSGSSDSVIAVEPARSAESAVTTRRSSRMGCCALTPLILPEWARDLFVVLLDRRELVEAGIDQAAVGSRAAVDDVGRAVLRVEPVVAGAAEQRVVARAAVELVVAGAADRACRCRRAR